MRISVCFAYLSFVAMPILAQQTVPQLPIPVGIYINSVKQCTSELSGWVFDGRRIGWVGFNPNMRPAGKFYGEVKPFTSVKTAKNGYTEFRPEGFGEIGRMLVKQETADQITLVLRAPSRERIEESADSLKRCAYQSLSQRMQAAVSRFAPSVADNAAPVAGGALQPITGTRWAVATRPNVGASAYVEGPPAMNAIGLRCGADGSILMFVSAVGQPMNRPLVATFASTKSGANVDANLRFDPQSRLFAGTAVSALVGLLGGNDAALDLRINGKAAGRVSMAGSTAAIREALAPCLGTRAAQDASAATGAPVLPPLGIAAGYYVDEGTLCTDPIEAFYFDGRRAGTIFAEGGIAPDPIGKVRKQGGEFLLPNEGILVKVLGPTRIQLTIQDTGGPMRLCPTEQIPPSIRRLVR